MKYIIGLFALISVALAPIGAQQSIELTMRFERCFDSNCFSVYYRPMKSFPEGFHMGPQQITVVTPRAIDAEQLVVLPNATGGQWGIRGGNTSVQCNSKYCFIAFATNGAPIKEALQAGEEYLLFQFTVKNQTCVEGLRLHDIRLDPIDPDGSSEDFANSMYIIAEGKGGEAYAGTYSNHGTRCTPRVEAPGLALANAEFSIYPNPAIDGVFIEMEYFEDVLPTEIQIFNSLGQLVHHLEIPKGSVKEYIDFKRANINAGSYTLRIFDNNSETLKVEKLIVQRPEGVNRS